MGQLKVKISLFIAFQVVLFSSMALEVNGVSVQPVFLPSKNRLQSIQNIQGRKPNVTEILKVVDPSIEFQDLPSSVNVNLNNRRVSVPSAGVNVVTGTTTRVNSTNFGTSGERRDSFRSPGDVNAGASKSRLNAVSGSVSVGAGAGMSPREEVSARKSYINKPSPTGNYYQPYPKPTQTTVVRPPSPDFTTTTTTTTARPTTVSTFTTTTTTTTTSFPEPEPEPSTTEDNIIDIILIPTEEPTEGEITTVAPIIITTASTESGGIEGEDEDEDDSDSQSRRGTSRRTSFQWPSNARPFSHGIGRSRTTTLDGKTLRTTTKTPLQPFRLSNRDRGQSARAMKFSKEEDPDVVTDFVFSNIKCFRTQLKEYFGASIHMKSGFHVPYIRDRPQDPLTNSDCRMQRLDTPNAYHINITDLKGCGVEQCGDSYCLTMVFPRVPTLALADDEVTTIKCEPQKSAISEVRSISFAGDNLESRRSSSTVEGGGQDFAAEVGVFRQNPGTNNGLFVKRVNSGGVVQLGEPLQLRSVVRGGDGWSHSKLSDVKVWRMKDSHPQNYDSLNPMDASEVITLVDGRGCRNPEYEVIADSHPLRDPRNSLVHHFTFRAFLFRGQRPNEPLIVTAKVQACQEGTECQPIECSGGRRNKDPNVSRFKRSTFEGNSENTVVRDFSSQLALRVVGLQDNSVSVTEEDFNDNSQQIQKSVVSHAPSCTERMAFSALAGGAIVLLLGGLVFSLIFFSFNSRRNSKLNQNAGCDSSRYENTRATSPTLSPSASASTSTNSGNKLTWRKPPTDSFHTNAIRKQNKPLPLPPPPPPPPMDYAELRFGHSSNNNKVNASITSSNDDQVKHGVAKILHHLNPEENEDPSEYESLESPREKHAKVGPKKDGVFIVYCYDKKWNSTSAPSSLREKKRSRKKSCRYQHEDPCESDESDGSCNKCHKFSHPRTVRNVKQIQSKKRASGGIRRRLSSIYREVYRNRYRTGSFPARIPATYDSQTSGRKSILNRDKECSDIYSDAFANFNSDMDSAYCGSEGFKTKQQGSHSVRNLEAVFRVSEKTPSYYREHRKIFNEVLPTNNDPAIPSTDGCNSPLGRDNTEPTPTTGKSAPLANISANNATSTHCVSRNDLTTQIIIIPETDV